MGRALSLRLIGVLSTVVLSAACAAPAPAPASPPVAAQPAQTPVERGRYLVTIAACTDCHTPFKMGANGPEPDTTRLLSGHPQDLKVVPPPTLSGPWGWAGTATNTAFAGPWGISYAINLTSDAETGLGNWTEEMFVQAMRTGKHMGTSRPIQPPMPWPAIGQMTDEDLKAVFAYLRSLPPLVNRVPAYADPKTAQQ
jgi:mono/diheme cytochrome c family protein